jgi:uncharacterized protein YkwD
MWQPEGRWLGSGHVLSRRSPLLIVALVLAVGLTSAAPASAGTRSARAKMFHFVNAYRRDHGRRVLRESKDVDRLAQHHSRLMAADRKLFHSSGLSTKLRSHKPSTWGENIGMGPSVWAVFKAWTRSSEHRANMLRRGFRHAGVGVVRAHGALWITMIFYG